MNVFEKIIKKELPADIVYESDNVLAFNDIKPLAKVHIIVIPKKTGISNILDASPDELNNLFESIKIISKKLNLDKDGFRVVTNLGQNANQTIEHLHFHIIGGEQLGKPC